jgi:hypothetical protein
MEDSMTKQLGPNASSLIDQALREEKLPDPTEIARVRRSVLRAAAAVTVTTSAAPLAAQTLAAKALWFGVIGKSSFLSAVGLGISIGAVTFGGGPWVVRHLDIAKNHAVPAASSNPATATRVQPVSLEFGLAPPPAPLSAAASPLSASSAVAPPLAAPSGKAVPIQTTLQSVAVRTVPRPSVAPIPVIEQAASGILPNLGPDIPQSTVGPQTAVAVAKFEPVGHGSLSEELAQLEGAQRAMSRGDATKALALLDQLNAHPSSSVLLDERLALEAIAACQTGQHERAVRVTQKLSQRNPNSPLVSRVRASCAGRK